MPSKPEPIPCVACGRAFAAASAVCPFCGKRRLAAAPSENPSALKETSETGPQTSPAAPPPEQNSEPLCPGCGTGTDLKKLFVESWESQGTTFTGKQKFLVRSIEIPAYCGQCSRGLTKKRLLAALVTAIPLWFFGIVVALSLNKPAFPLVVLGLYSLYLFKAFFYSWGDRLIYGLELETKLREKTAVLKPETARVIFPIGLFFALGRLVFFFLTTFILILLVAGISEGIR